MRSTLRLALLVALAGGGLAGGGLAGCGAAPRRTASLDAELEARGLTTARSQAAEAVERAEHARDDAHAADAAGLVEVADEHATRARAWADAARAEADEAASASQLVALTEARIALEAELAASEHEAHDAREATERLAAGRAAREEVLRALARAEADEAAPRRARRLGLAEAAELRTLATALLDRARLLHATARTLVASVPRGAPFVSPPAQGSAPGSAPPAQGSAPPAQGSAALDEAQRALDEAQRALDEAQRVDDPAARLAAADRAHGLARVALGAARRLRGDAQTSPEALASLVEAFESEGFVVVRDERGLGTELELRVDGRALSPASRSRLERLARLVASYPEGPVLVLVDGDPSAPPPALVALVAGALVGASRAHEVLVVRFGTTPSARIRVVLPAYVPRGPEPVDASH